MPDAEQREALWISKLEQYGIHDPVEIEVLKEVELSGALIENVAKKAQRFKIVKGKQAVIDTAILRQFALQERMKLGNCEEEPRKIGFGR